MRPAAAAWAREDELAATGLVQPGSRVWYTLLAAGERQPVAQFRGSNSAPAWSPDMLLRALVG